MQEEPELFTEDHKKLLKIVFDINNLRIKSRITEIKKILEKCEDLYISQDFKIAKEIIGFAVTLADKTGIEEWQMRANVLKKKILRSLNVLMELDKFKLDNLESIPPMMIQIKYAKLETLWEECQEDKNRQDSIHSGVIETLQKIRGKLKVFMKEHKIEPLQVNDSKQTSIWGSTKTSINMKGNEARFNHLIKSAKKAESLMVSKEELQKAYRLVQENPSHFSVENQKLIVNLIADIDEKIEKVSENTEKDLLETKRLIDEFKFKKALEKLHLIAQDLESRNMKDDLEHIVDEIHICEVNSNIYEKYKIVEQAFKDRDILGVKTKLLSFQEELDAFEEKDLLVEPLQQVIAGLQSKSIGISPTPVNAGADFNPFGEDDLTPAESFKKNEESQNLMKKFQNKLEKEKEIKRTAMAKYLKLNDDQLFERLLEWKNSLRFSLKNGYILEESRAMDLSVQSSKKESIDAISDEKINPSKENREKSDKKTNKKIKEQEEKEKKFIQSKKEQDALDALDDLLDDDMN